MKRNGKKKIVSLFMALTMVIATVFSVNFSNVKASTNEEKARELISKMSLEEKIGQKIMLSFRSGWQDVNGKNLGAVQNINDEIYEIIGKYDIGSVILFAANFAADATINVELTEGLQRAAMDKGLGKNNIPLLIAADQEGGIVYRLTGGTALPGNMALGATNDIENAVEAGKVIGSELNAVGVNTNFAPVADVNNNANNPVIGLRSFSSNPHLAADFVSAYIKGVQSENVATTAKHFPGHGNVVTDSHTGLPAISSTKEELYQTELVPFQAAIDAGTDMVMTAHIQFPNIVTEEIYSDKKGEMMSPPATLSREILTDLLRGEMGFDGVIATDSMTMAGVANYFDTNERNLLAVKAGVDILDIPFNDISSMADMKTKLIPLIDAFVDAYTKDDGYNGIKLSVDELDKSVERILICKYNRGVMDLENDTTTLAQKKAIATNVVGSVANRETERKIAAAATTVVKNENAVLPLKLNENSKIVFATTYSRNNNRFVLAWQRAKQAGIIPEGADYKILQHYNWTGLNDNVNSAKNSDGTNFQGTNKDVLDWGDTLVHVSEISSASGIDGYIVACPQLFINYCEGQGKQTVAVSLNHPYDVQAFAEADAIVAVYGTTSAGVDITESFGGGTVSAMAAFSPNLTGGIEVILGTFGASGKLPVDIPKYVPGSKVYSTDENVFELGYGLTYDALVPDPDKTALNKAILTATLNEEDFTAESWNNAASQLAALKEELKTAANTNLTHKLAQSRVDQATAELQEKYEAALNVLVYNSSKLALSIALKVAGEVTQEQLDKVVPAVVTEFEAALANAQAVYDKVSVSQVEIDDAFNRLANAMHLLEFFKGNKVQLQKIVNQIASLNADAYTDSSWDAMQPALTRASEVLDNANVMQEEVDQVYSDLVKAFLNLRLKPNKDLLAELINKATNLRAASYTLASWADMTNILNEVKGIYDDPNATIEEVKQAETALTKAIEKLEIKPDDAIDIVDNTPTNAVKSGDTTITAIKTGDDIAIVPIALLSGLSLVGLWYSRKKKMQV